MRERPSWPMKEWEVRAILDGRKTMTRRVMKYPGFPHRIADIQHREPGDKWYGDHVWSMRTRHGVWGDYTHDEFMGNCPYGAPGDRLWVRETWGYDRPGGILDKHDILYRADTKNQCQIWSSWKPSIHMPRWASRINLEITEVRVERLQDISEEDAVDEGTAYYIAAGKMKCEIMSMRSAFADLWDSLNAKRGFGWDADPWVWAIRFRRQP